MPKQTLSISRRRLLGSSAVALSALALPNLTSTASATATPQADDVGFLVFGANVEAVLSRLYSNALKLPSAWSAAERRLLVGTHSNHRRNVDRINAVLGPEDAVALDSFTRVVPVKSRAEVLKSGRDLEKLAQAVYLTGITEAEDPLTRLLLGRMLSTATTGADLLGRWSHLPLAGLPSPISIDDAGPKLDLYLEDPS